MKKCGIMVLLLLSVASAPVYSDAPSFPATTANIAAWNLKGSYMPRRKAAVFADVIAYLDPEVLALVEVKPDFMAAEIVAELADMGICYRRAILDQRSPLNIAILYKSGVQLSNPRLIPGSDANDPADCRKALAADMKIGEFDFILIVVHMQAGRDNNNRAIRDAQATAIATFIENVTAGNEKDVLVVGDYNMIPTQDQSNFTNMSPGGFLDFVSDRFVGQFSHISEAGIPDNLLDGYAVSAGHTSEYISGSIRIIQMHEVLGLPLSDYGNDISDHFPLNAVFRITDDDD